MLSNVSFIHMVTFFNVGTQLRHIMEFGKNVHCIILYCHNSKNIHANHIKVYISGKYISWGFQICIIGWIYRVGEILYRVSKQKIANKSSKYFRLHFLLFRINVKTNFIYGKGRENPFQKYIICYVFDDVIELYRVAKKNLEFVNFKWNSSYCTI